MNQSTMSTRIGCLVVATALLLGVACTTASEDSDRAPIVVPEDAQGIIDAAVAALEDVDSYRAEYSSPVPADDARGKLTWQVQYEAPDSYRFLQPWANGPTVERCEPYTRPGGYGEHCRDVVTEVTERGLREAILVGDVAYGRECDAAGQPCAAWREQPRPDVPLFGPSPSFMPGWPPVVLETMDVSGDLGTGDDAMVRVSGTANLLRAIFENSRRFADVAGVNIFGEECEVQPTPGGGNGEEVCRELTFEEMLEQEDDVAFEDENPSEVVVWVSTSDLRPRRIEITQAPRPGETEAGTFVIEYSDFNEIEIEAPQ